MADVHCLVQIDQFAVLPQAIEELTEILLHERSPEANVGRCARGAEWWRTLPAERACGNPQRSRHIRYAAPPTLTGRQGAVLWAKQGHVFVVQRAGKQQK